MKETMKERENFRPHEWTIRCGEHTYKAIGYEQRGIFGVPIACIIDDKCISCYVYEIVIGLKVVEPDVFIGAERLNTVEIDLLKTVGCIWTGCWITKVEPTGITLDDDEISKNEEDYYLHLELFNEFEKNLMHYLLYDKRADENVFKLWYAFEQDIAKATNSDTMADNKVCLIVWLKEDWGAFFECILDGSFKYMNVSNIVLDAWNRFCE